MCQLSRPCKETAQSEGARLDLFRPRPTVFYRAYAQPCPSPLLPPPCRASINMLLGAALRFVASQAPLLAGSLQPALLAGPLNSRLEQLSVVGCC